MGKFHVKAGHVKIISIEKKKIGTSRQKRDSWHVWNSIIRQPVKQMEN